MTSLSDVDNAITANIENTTTSNHIIEDSVSSMQARDVTGDSTSGFTDEGTIGSAVTVDIEIITSNNLTIEGNASSISTNDLTSDSVSIEDSASSIPDSNPAGDSSISSAESHAFALPEILENILLHLPMLDLLLAQRVCKTFHGAINSSIHIKRALFFETRPQTQREKDLHTAPGINPLLKKMFQKNLIHPIDLTGELDSDRGPTLEKLRQVRDIVFEIPDNCLPMVFNGQCCKSISRIPLGDRAEPWTSDLPDDSLFMHLPCLLGLESAESTQLPLSNAQTDPKASWRRMHATNVPTPIHSCAHGKQSLGQETSILIHHKDLESSKMGDIMRRLDPRHLFLELFPDGQEEVLERFLAVM